VLKLIILKYNVFYKISEVAKKLNISYNGVFYLIEQKKINAIFYKNQWLIPQKQLEYYMNKKSIL
jgi:excisionase family DNA binding protein